MSLGGGKRKSSVRDYIRKEPTSAELGETLAELRKGTDRTAAILAAAMVQANLDELLLSALPRTDKLTEALLYGQDGPLTRFANCINIGYALALFDDDIRQDLNSIRTIRNAFAHSRLPLTFKTRLIRQECMALKVVTIQVDDPRIAATLAAGEFAKALPYERGIFVTACISIGSHFIDETSKNYKQGTADFQKQTADLKRRQEDLLGLAKLLSSGQTTSP